MTTESMNIHQALCELKMLEKRIAAAIRDGIYVAANKHTNTKISGVELPDFIEDIKSRYQKVSDLMKRYDAIKCAVVLSNASTKVEIAGKTYTVAEAIEMKNHGIDRYRSLMNKLAGDFNLAKMAADRANGSDLDRRADDHIKNMYGSTDIKGMTEEVKRTREEFIKAQTVELVDPLGVQKKVTEMSDWIAEFQTQVDSALSTSNAITMIEVTY